jgi:branched-subunit amino acid aminotransferase/4-amino-4-deoxychorismate lyase
MSPARERQVWIDGRLVAASAATVPFLDRGAHDGGGLFETLRIYQRRPFGWDRHLERLVVSAAELGFPVAPAPALLERALDEVLTANQLVDAAARLTMTRGIPGRRPTRAGTWVEVEPIESRLWRGTRRGGARVRVSRPCFSPGSTGRHKTTSRLAYHLAREEARAARADEALLLDASGAVLEGSASNLFAVREGRIVTPPLALGILPGITRAIVLELCDSLGLGAEEANLDLGDLAGASEIFLTNSLQEVVPVVELDGAPVPTGDLAPRLAAAYRQRVATEIAEQNSPPRSAI